MRIKLFRRLLRVKDLIFNTNLFNAEKIHSEIALKGKLNSNMYIHFLIAATNENWVYELLLFKLDMVIGKGSIKVPYKASSKNES